MGRRRVLVCFVRIVIEGLGVRHTVVVEGHREKE